MWSDGLVFCVCGFHSVCPLMEKDKRLMEASWWETLTEGEDGSCSDGLDHAQFNSVQFSCAVLSDSLWPHELQHSKTPCPSPTLGAYPNSCQLSRWCHPTISFSVILFSSCCQFFPASGSFQMSQLFASSGQSIGGSASASVLPMNTQDWSPLGWTGWISLQSKGLKSLLQHHSSKASILWKLKVKES